jgi:hypothetical protein
MVYVSANEKAVSLNVHRYTVEPDVGSDDFRYVAQDAAACGKGSAVSRCAKKDETRKQR